MILVMAPRLEIKMDLICPARCHFVSVLKSIAGKAQGLCDAFNKYSFDEYNEQLEGITDPNVIGKTTYLSAYISTDIKNSTATVNYMIHQRKLVGYDKTTKQPLYKHESDKAPFKGNMIQCIVYEKSNKVRGSDATLAFIDEGNFQDPEMFPEQMGTSSKEGVKTFLISSDSIHGLRNDMVNIAAKPRAQKLRNAVAYVCMEHTVCLVCSLDGINSKCICFYNAEPVHNNKDPVTMAVVTSFTPWNGKDEDEPDLGDMDANDKEEEAERRHAGGEDENNNFDESCMGNPAEAFAFKAKNLLAHIRIASEIGAIPPGTDIKKIIHYFLDTGLAAADKNVDMSLVPDIAHLNFKTNRFNMYHVMNPKDITNVVCPTVYIYIDPAGNETAFSKHGMAMVALTKNVMTGQETAVILSVDEYNTGFFDEFYEELSHFEREEFSRGALRHDPNVAIALMTMRAICSTVRKYNSGHSQKRFAQFIILPEGNFQQMNAFWAIMGRLRNYDPVYRGPEMNGVDIFATLIETANTLKKKRYGNPHYKTGLGEGAIDSYTKQALQEKASFGHKLLYGIDESGEGGGGLFDPNYLDFIGKSRDAGPVDVITKGIEHFNMRHLAQSICVLNEGLEFERQRDLDESRRSFVGYILHSEKANIILRFIQLYAQSSYECEKRVMLATHLNSTSLDIMSLHYDSRIALGLPACMEEDVGNPNAIQPHYDFDLFEFVGNKIKSYKIKESKNTNRKMNTGDKFIRGGEMGAKNVSLKSEMNKVLYGKSAGTKRTLKFSGKGYDNDGNLMNDDMAVAINVATISAFDFEAGYAVGKPKKRLTLLRVMDEQEQQELLNEAQYIQDLIAHEEHKCHIWHNSFGSSIENVGQDNYDTVVEENNKDYLGMPIVSC